MLTFTVECTAKALTHRLAKIRQLAKADPNDASVQEANGGGKKGKGAGVLGAPKNGRGKKAAARAATPTSNDDEDDTNGAARTPPPTGRPERNGGKKRDYAALAGENDQGDDEAGEEDDAGGLNKKVKIEVGEDVGEGLRQTNEFEEKLGEMEQGGDIFA